MHAAPGATLGPLELAPGTPRLRFYSKYRGNLKFYRRTTNFRKFPIENPYKIEKSRPENNNLE